MPPDGPQCVTWSPDATDARLQVALRVLGQEYPIREAEGATPFAALGGAAQAVKITDGIANPVQSA